MSLFILIPLLFLFFLFLISLHLLRLHLHGFNLPLLFLLGRRGLLNTIRQDLLLVVLSRLLFLFILYSVSVFLKKRGNHQHLAWNINQTLTYSEMIMSCSLQWSNPQSWACRWSEEFCFKHDRYKTGPREGPASSIVMLLVLKQAF